MSHLWLATGRTPHPWFSSIFVTFLLRLPLYYFFAPNWNNIHMSHSLLLTTIAPISLFIYVTHPADAHPYLTILPVFPPTYCIFFLIVISSLWSLYVTAPLVMRTYQRLPNFSCRWTHHPFDVPSKLALLMDLPFCPTDLCRVSPCLSVFLYSSTSLCHLHVWSYLTPLNSSCLGMSL